MPLTEFNREPDYLASQEVDKPRDHCGVWAIWDPGNPDVLSNAFIGLKNIQHRGEQGAGVASVSATTEGVQYVRGHGKVVEVLGDDGAGLDVLPGDSYAANAHTWYGTDGGSGDSVQPRVESLLSLSHNGQITNKDELADKYAVNDYTSDSDLVAKIINKVAVDTCDGDVEKAIVQVLPYLRGAFCLTILTPDKLFAVRDRHGVRPLQLGTTETGGFVVASEVMAINKVPGAAWQREIEPAEMVVISNSGLRSGMWAREDPAVCVFEYFYLSNKTNIINGQVVADVRQALGGRMARFVGPHVTEIVPFPNSGNQPARGLSDATGIPYVTAFKKNPDFQDSRSFIQPNDAAREEVADRKLNLDASLVDGEGIGAVDDTMVRGITAKVNVDKLRKAGAASIDLYIAAPPYSETCELGVDTGNPKELLAARMDGDVEKMRRELGVDSLSFLTTEDVRAVLGNKVCDHCIGGEKPNLIAPNSSETVTRFGQLALMAP